MSTEIPGNLTEAELLLQYIGKRVTNGGRHTSVSELLNGYVAYRRELADLQAKVRQAEQARAPASEDASRCVSREGICRSL